MVGSGRPLLQTAARWRCEMGSLGPIHLAALILAVAAIAGTAGFVTASVVRRNRRRARGFFVLGFLCGISAATVRRHKRRVLRVLDSAPLPIGRSPTSRRR